MKLRIDFSLFFKGAWTLLYFCLIQLAWAEPPSTSPVPASRSAEEVVSVADEIFGSFMSPFCPGRLLQDCPSGAARDLKEEIRGRLSKGESPDVIKDELITAYGETIEAAPPTHGFSLTAWLMPFIFLIAGFIAIVLWLRRNKFEPENSPPAPLSQVDRKRVAEALSKIDQRP